MGSTGEQLGVMRLNDALRRAQTLGLDLVEVAPSANPPVCKIIDFGKFRYDISKHTKDKKPASSKLKEIKFRVNIDEHDYLTKIRHGEEFLDRGNKVRVQLPCATAISRPRNGASRIWNATRGEGTRGSFRHVASGNGPKDHRSQHHHDSGASAS